MAFPLLHCNLSDAAASMGHFIEPFAEILTYHICLVLPVSIKCPVLYGADQLHLTREAFLKIVLAWVAGADIGYHVIPDADGFG